MELYLRWLDRHERHHEHEAPPIGLILCSEKDHEQVELLLGIPAKPNAKSGMNPNGVPG